MYEGADHAHTAKTALSHPVIISKRKNLIMANFHHCKVHYIWASLYNGNLDVCISEVLTQLMFTVFCTLEFEVTLNETVGYRIFAIFFYLLWRKRDENSRFRFSKFFQMLTNLAEIFFREVYTYSISNTPPPSTPLFTLGGRTNTWGTVHSTYRPDKGT